MKLLSLTKKKDFDVLFSKGKRVFKSHLTVAYLSLNSDVEVSNLKIAYIVSKKISAKAVIRNKIKRRMRAAMRQILAKITLKNEISAKTILIAILPSKKFLIFLLNKFT
ncbi:MAG: ribonuclease P protein component [Rickettsiales bacterium]|nr:ribonuclease P protein component [Rickettsiales bacterium]